MCYNTISSEVKMKIRLCCCLFVADTIGSVSKKKNDKKKLQVLVEKNTYNLLSIDFDEKTDLRIQMRRKLQNTLGTNMFHLEQVYTLGDSKFFKDGYLDIIYVAIACKENIKKLDNNYEFVDFSLKTKKSIMLGDHIYSYSTKATIINDNIEYYHFIDTNNLNLEKSLIELLIALKFLKGRVKNTGIIFYLLNRFFTLEDIRIVYELITEEVVDKSNFRKKYSVYCTETAEVIRNKGFRPAKIFKCNIKDIENLYR